VGKTADLLNPRKGSAKIQSHNNIYERPGQKKETGNKGGGIELMEQNHSDTESQRKPTTGVKHEYNEL